MWGIGSHIGYGHASAVRILVMDSIAVRILVMDFAVRILVVDSSCSHIGYGLKLFAFWLWTALRWHWRHHTHHPHSWHQWPERLWISAAYGAHFSNAK